MLGILSIFSAEPELYYPAGVFDAVHQYYELQMKTGGRKDYNLDSVRPASKGDLIPPTWARYADAALSIPSGFPSRALDHRYVTCANHWY